LVQDFYTMGDEKNPLELTPVTIKCAEPCFAEASGEDDEAGGVTRLAGLIQGSQSLALNVMRIWREFGGFDYDAGRIRSQHGPAAARVFFDPFVRNGASRGVSENRFESALYFG
jgi:hypothetical protein